MLLIDTHSHLYLEQFDADRDVVIQSALDRGVGRILLPNIDVTSIEAMHKLAAAYPRIFFPMMGLHPTSVKEDYREVFEIIKNELSEGRYIAIGEIGIDLYWDKSRLTEQILVFEQELQLALALKKPVVIHARDSFDMIFEVLEKFEGTGLQGVFHAFSGTPEQADHVIEQGFMLGIGGMITYKNTSTGKVVQQTDLSHMVLETDSPFLPPVPHRGKRNEPAFLYHVAEAVAHIKGMTVSEVAHITSENASKLFNLKITNA
jgi:TatD DNase family protein